MSDQANGNSDEFWQWWYTATEVERSKWALSNVSIEYVGKGQRKGGSRFAKEIGKALCDAQDQRDDARATIAHLSVVIEEATEHCNVLIRLWNDRHSDSGLSAYRVEEAADLLAILAKATPTLKHSKDLTVGEK